MLNALKNLYTKLGGALTDTYEAIAGGKPVSDYILKTDVVAACAEKAEGGGGAIEVIEFTMGESGAVSNKTAGEIFALSNTGKTLIGRVTVAENFVMQLQIGQVSIVEGDYVLGVIAATDNGEAPVCITSLVDDENDHFTISMGG